MSPLLKTNIGVIVRAAILLLGAHGIEITPDDQVTLERAVEMLINGALIVGPVLWSFYQKWKAHDRIRVAELRAELAQRR